MKQNNRPTKPESLNKKSKEWTQNLLDEINRQRGYSNVDSSFKNKYKKDDILEALKAMYSDHCCYCESGIGSCSYPHIEHYKPRNQFPQLAYDWQNLHLACQVCNTNKSTKWNRKAPLINPESDEYQKHIEYVLDLVEAKTERGITTINTVELNRDALKESRLKIASRLLRILHKYQLRSNRVDKENLKTRMNEFLNDEIDHYSLCKSIINSFTAT